MSDPTNPPQIPQQLPPGAFAPPPPPRSGIPGWVIALIVAGGAVGACIVGAIVIIGILTLLGGRVSEVFSTIESDLDMAAVVGPIDRSTALPVGDEATLGDLRISVVSAAPLSDVSAQAAGHVVWVVEATFTNRARSGARTISRASSAIHDDTAAIYPYSYIAESAAGGEQPRASIRAGERVQMRLFYEVPGDAGQLYWAYHTDEGAVVFTIE